MEIKDQRPPPEDRYYDRYYDRDDRYRGGRDSDRRHHVGDFRKQSQSHTSNMKQDSYRQGQRERSRSHVDNYKSPINRNVDPRIKVDNMDESGKMIESISIADEALITDRDDLDAAGDYSESYKPMRNSTVKVSKTSGGILTGNKIKGSKFTNQTPQAMNSTQKSGLDSIDQGDSYYDDDAFESMSMSKSMGGIGFGLSQKNAKSNTAKKSDKYEKRDITKSSAGGDDYSDEDFESVTQSKSISVSQSKSLSIS